MALFNMKERSYGVTRFVTVQLIALIGWIIVQSSFTLSPWGQTIPFPVIMVVESIWWIATLVIMFFLFRREYKGFVQAVLELEEANRRLRTATNSFLLEQRDHGDQGFSTRPCMTSRRVRGPGVWFMRRGAASVSVPGRWM